MNMTARRSLLAACAVVVALAPGAGSAAAGKPQTISLLAINVYTGIEGYNPGGVTPPTIGSGFVGYGTLYKWAGVRRGARAGSIRVFCTFTSVDPAPATPWTDCDATLFLPPGEIELSGFIPQSSVVNLPVVGGTGAYAQASGYVRVERIGVNKFADIVHLTR